MGYKKKNIPYVNALILTFYLKRKDGYKKIACKEKPVIG